MCARLLIYIAYFLILIIGTQPTFGQIQRFCDYISVDDGITYRTLVQGTDISDRSPCHDEQCRAIKDISCAISGLSHHLTPNTMGYRSPREAEYFYNIYTDNIRALGRQYPKRIPLYCKLLARVAAVLTGDKEHDGRTLENITTLAIRLEHLHASCLTQVLDALPQIPALQQDSHTRWARECLHDIRQCDPL